MKTRILFIFFYVVLFASTSSAQSFSMINARILRLAENGLAITSKSILLKAPVLASSYTLTMPQNDGSDGQVLTTDGSGVLSWTFPDRMLGFISGKDQAVPNNFQEVRFLKPDYVLSDIAIVPSGNGSLLAAIPDNTSTGGDKRGSKAVDFQMTRNDASEVASGGAW